MNDTTWEVEAFRGVGPVKFGMSSAEVQKAVGKAESFYRHGDGPPKLEYLSGAIAVSFRKSSKGVDSVAFSNRLGCVGPSLHGRRLLGEQWEQVMRWLAEWGYECTPFDAGVDCFDLGLSLSREDDEHGREVVDIVIVWAEGYLDAEKPHS